MPDVTVSIVDAGDLRRLMRDLREVEDGKELSKELRTGLRGVLNPLRDQVKAAYRSAPGYQGKRSRSRAKQPDLRVLLVKATKTEVRTTGRLAGARLRVDGRKMPSGLRSLPSMWEGPPQGKRWRHPVFGDRGVWVAQDGRSTFYRIADGHEDDARRAITQVVDGVRAKLERGR
jgi:hypothetical protein